MNLYCFLSIQEATSKEPNILLSSLEVFQFFFVNHLTRREMFENTMEILWKVFLVWKMFGHVEYVSLPSLLEVWRGGGGKGECFR